VPLLLQVLEFESLGIHVRNTKRFFVLNPTSISYEFTWSRMVAGNNNSGPNASSAAGPGGGGGSGSGTTGTPFACATKRGIISGGR
jgi:hydrocephalus-inducing protein